MNIREIYDSYLAENQKSTDIEKTKSTPHLALCLEDNPSANNRHISLMLKASGQPSEFEMFCKSMTSEKTLIALYSILKNESQDELLKQIIKGK